MNISQPYKALSILESSEDLSSRLTPQYHGSYVQAHRPQSPRLLAWSRSLAALMGFSPDQFLAELSGQRSWASAKPVALRYGGHQFGHWAGQLGDGRAMTIAEIEHHNRTFELQLKGAGRTPYSRTADGKAVLRSSLREYVCSEAMHFLGVPTTRALSLVLTGESVIRDILYSGNPQPEPGAICSRVAESFLRFGNFQIHAAHQEEERLRELLTYTLERYYPGHTTLSFFEELMDRTAFMVSEWMRVGFVHGVMNTDNMSILGLTIDYGPFGWLDEFDLNWTPNTTDASHHRYAYGKQPQVCYWNLARLAEALAVVEPGVIKAIEKFPSLYLGHFKAMVNAKLGLTQDSDTLAQSYFEIMQNLKGDMTIFHRYLMRQLQNVEVEWQDCFYESLTTEDRSRLAAWLVSWRALTDGNSLARMQKVNPVFIPRNYILQLAIDEVSRGEEKLLREIELALETPYEENEFNLRFLVKRPDWARDKVGCSTLSCSS